MSLRVGFVLLLLALFAPSRSRAYCRRSSCDGITGTRCTPADPTDCGVPLWWPSGCVTYSPWQAPTPDPAVDARHAAALEQAFARWQAADCGGGRPPRLHVTRTAAESLASFREYLGEMQRQRDAKTWTYGPAPRKAS